MRMAALCAAVAFPALCSARVLPTPQSLTRSGEPVLIVEPQPLQIVMSAKPSKQAHIAAELLRSSLAAMDSTITARLVTAKERSGAGVAIFLWDAAEGLPPISLAQADREALDRVRRFGQSYVLLTRGNKEIWAIGSTGQGILYAVATLVQLFEPSERGLRVDGVHVRDFPDFRYRAASDWLLRAELNRWAYDWGDGRRAYVERIKRKLDFCTRFKINMVLFDGFGWTAEKTPGYAGMMRDLNAYARDRGIKLMFSGFGANFDPAKVEPEFNIGKVFFNRDAYPHGRIYPCFGEARTADHPTYGTCRSNEALNAEIASEFESFVRTVEPGALYIHHEDTGHYDRTQRRWSERCDRCKRKWPNPDFAAADGGAGAMAHGYSNILRAVQRVKNADSGYEAARDCTTVFISPPIWN